MAGGRIGSILAPLAFELLAQKESHMLFWLLSSILCVFAVAVIKRCLTFELKGEPLEDVVLKRGDLRVKRPSLLTPSSEKRLPGASQRRTQTVSKGMPTPCHLSSSTAKRFRWSNAVQLRCEARDGRQEAYHLAGTVR
eukprot:g17935.t1